MQHWRLRKRLDEGRSSGARKADGNTKLCPLLNLLFLASRSSPETERWDTRPISDVEMFITWGQGYLLLLRCHYRMFIPSCSDSSMIQASFRSCVLSNFASPFNSFICKPFIILGNLLGITLPSTISPLNNTIFEGKCSFRQYLK